MAQIRSHKSFHAHWSYYIQVIFLIVALVLHPKRHTCHPSFQHKHHSPSTHIPPVPLFLNSLLCHTLPISIAKTAQSINRTQQLRLQNEFPLFVLLTSLIRLIIFPAHRLLALLANHIPHRVPARRHVALDRFGLRGVDDGVEEVGFAVLAAEVLE